jgi:hypothetical protein
MEGGNFMPLIAAFTATQDCWLYLSHSYSGDGRYFRRKTIPP